MGAYQAKSHSTHHELQNMFSPPVFSYTSLWYKTTDRWLFSLFSSIQWLSGRMYHMILLFVFLGGFLGPGECEQSILNLNILCYVAI